MEDGASTEGASLLSPKQQEQNETDNRRNEETFQSFALPKYTATYMSTQISDKPVSFTSEHVCECVRLYPFAQDENKIPHCSCVKIENRVSRRVSKRFKREYLIKKTEVSGPKERFSEQNSKQTEPRRPCVRVSPTHVFMLRGSGMPLVTLMMVIKRKSVRRACVCHVWALSHGYGSTCVCIYNRK